MFACRSRPHQVQHLLFVRVHKLYGSKTCYGMTPLSLPLSEDLEFSGVLAILSWWAKVLLDLLQEGPNSSSLPNLPTDKTIWSSAVCIGFLLIDFILRNSKHAAHVMTSLQPMHILLKQDLSSGLFLFLFLICNNIVDSADPTLGIGDCESLECTWHIWF